MPEPRSTEPGVYDRYFETIRPLGSIPVRRAGQTIRSVALYYCERQRLPFPFDGRPRYGPHRPRRPNLNAPVGLSPLP